MALCTQADIEKYLQVDFANEPEDAITMAIEFADATIAMLTDRALEQTTYTDEVYDGGDGRNTVIFLKEWPVTAVAQITEEGDVVPSNEYTWYPDGRVYRHLGAEPSYRIGWHHGRQNITVTYTAGYAPAAVPNDLRMISTSIASRIFKQGAEWANGVDPGVIKESIGDYRATYAAAREVAAENVVTSFERTMLGRYKRRLN